MYSLLSCIFIPTCVYNMYVVLSFIIFFLQMKCALQQYGVNFNSEEPHAVVTTSSMGDSSSSVSGDISTSDTCTGTDTVREEDGEAVGREKSWASMRRLLYAQCAYFGKEAGDVVSAARFVHDVYCS